MKNKGSLKNISSFVELVEIGHFKVYIDTGDTMFKTEIEYRKNTLFVGVEGPLTRRNLAVLKRKLYYILTEYGIEQVVMNVGKTNPFDQEEFYRFLEEYDIEFGGQLTVVK